MDIFISTGSLSAVIIRGHVVSCCVNIKSSRDYWLCVTSSKMFKQKTVYFCANTEALSSAGTDRVNVVKHLCSLGLTPLTSAVNFHFIAELRRSSFRWRFLIFDISEVSRKLPNMAWFLQRLNAYFVVLHIFVQQVLIGLVGKKAPESHKSDYDKI